ncbi:MAG: HDOD domain-containing protein [Nitrospirota bacterium]|nr:HDOD domain-containing protein [Nitrospirota bacterium]MDH5587219.1 HDOD domain-containing protein [Nitrospirota bacterium]MDH5774473.1 HDOD domain-containing protein [Nitrospirota bacterium]
MLKITERVEGDRTILTLSGRFDFRARQPFQASLDQAKRSNPRQIILDFSEVPFINSAGLGLLLVAHKHLQEVNIELSCKVSVGYVWQVLTLAHIGQTIPIFLINAQTSSSTSQEHGTPTSSIPLPPPLNLESPEMLEVLLPFLEMLEKKDLDLPPLSEVARKVLAFTTDPKATMKQLTTLIEQDPMLTAKIFKLTNSAAFATHREIECLSQAIAWLGLNSVAGLAFALAVQDGVFNDHGYEREVRGLWAHAIATAFYAKTLAGMIGKNGDMAFLCGLLHGIGKLLVVHTVNLCRPATVALLPWSAMDVLVEQSYVEVGRQLGEAWHLPRVVKEAINLHQHYSYHLATHPSKGAPLTCLAKHLATYHLGSLVMSEPILRGLPVTADLHIPEGAMDEILASKSVIQAQIDSLLL